MIVAQKFGPVNTHDVSSTLRGMVMYAAGDRFVDGGTTVLSGDGLMTMYRLSEEMMVDRELASNISKAGYDDTGMTPDDIRNRIAESLQDALSDLGLDVYAIPVGFGAGPDTDDDAITVASNIRLLLRMQAAIELLPRIPTDYVEQRHLMRASRAFSGKEIDKLSREHGLIMLMDLLNLDVWYSSLPESITNQVDFDQVNLEIHAKYEIDLSCRHHLARALAMFDRNPNFGLVEIAYEETSTTVSPGDELERLIGEGIYHA